MSELVPQIGENEMQEVDINTWNQNDKNALIDYIARSHR